MKKTIVLASLGIAVLLVARRWQELPAAAQGCAGGDPAACKLQPTCWSIDSNGNGAVEIADAVHLLRWLFAGGEEPRVCLAQEDTSLEPWQLEALERLAFGHQVAGTWAFGEPGGAPPVVVTIAADGTGESNDWNDFTGGEVPGFQSEVRWSWRRTGERRLEVIGLFGVFDVDGIAWATVRIRGQLELSAGFDIVNGGLCESLFLLDQDPLDPAEVPAEQLSYGVFGRRLPFLPQSCP